LDFSPVICQFDRASFLCRKASLRNSLMRHCAIYRCDVALHFLKVIAVLRYVPLNSGQRVLSRCRHALNVSKPFILHDKDVTHYDDVFDSRSTYSQCARKKENNVRDNEARLETTIYSEQELSNQLARK